MKILTTPKCKKCGRRPLMIDDGSDLPAMIGFEMEDGKTINLCRQCIIDLGKSKESGNMTEWDAFFEEYT